MEIIQAMLSPAVMISACGLILLTLVPRLGRVIDRIRLLNAEKRDLKKEHGEKHRISIIDDQIQILLHRSNLLQLSSQYLFIAILSFVICSICIGLSKLVLEFFNILVIICFIVGMIFSFLGIVFSYKETRKSLHSVMEEIEIEEKNKKS